MSDEEKLAILGFRTLTLPEMNYTASDGTPIHVQGREMKLCDECDHHTYMHSRAGRMWRASCWARKSPWRQCGCKAHFARENQ